jgi:uncharacterized protein YbjT (DUF2867 family)
VLLSIVGLDHDQHVLHYTGKREQERRVMAGPIPWSVVRRRSSTTSRQREVGDMLAEVAAGAPLGRPIDIARPETQDLVDMARRTFAARGEQVRLVPTWRGIFHSSMAGEVLLPADGHGSAASRSTTGSPRAPAELAQIPDHTPTWVGRRRASPRMTQGTQRKGPRRTDTMAGSCRLPNREATRPAPGSIERAGTRALDS